MRFSTAYHVSAIALLAIAVVAVAQCVLFSRIVALGRDATHIMDITGTERVHSQVIAYELTAARDGHPEPHWRADIEAAIGEMIAIRSEIMRKKRYLSGPIGANGQTALADEADDYFQAARMLEHHPDDAATFARMRRLRSTLLDGYGRAVAHRAAIVASQSTELTIGLFVGLALQLLTIAVVWWRFLGPAERKARLTLRKLSAQRAELLSLFEQNPDAIAVYDRNGFLTHANAARVDLLAIPEDKLLGRHFSSFVLPHGQPAARQAFARALQGEHIVADTQFHSPSGGLMEIAYRLSPNVIDGATCGVIAVSRDMSQLRRAQALNEQMSQRLAALYAIASAGNTHWQQQIADALKLAAYQLSCGWGFVTETVEGRANLLAFVGDPPTFPASPASLTEPIAELIGEADDITQIDNLLLTPWRDESAARLGGWRSVVALRLHTARTTFGTFALAAAQPRTAPLQPADREFLLIVAELLGTIIDRGRTDAKLGSLAYFDPLTGLPNRAQLREKLNEFIAAAAARDAQFAVHFVDLDKFKEVNDACGHAVGDDVLRASAKRFAGCLRSSDIVARLGGDEFVILQMTNTGRLGAQELADRVGRAIAEPFVLDEVTYALGCSIGISLFPDDGTDAQTLLRHADEAMYRAKQSRGDRRIVFAA